MAPNTVHSKRRTEQLESPIRNRRCMDDRKNTIVDSQLRAHYVDQTPSTTSVFETVYTTGTSIINYLANSISSTFARMSFQILIPYRFVNYALYFSSASSQWGPPTDLAETIKAETTACRC